MIQDTSREGQPAVRVLIVEDEFIVAASMERMLGLWDYDVVDIVDSGEVAVEKTAELRPDVVLIDICLNGEIDGIEAASRIQSEFHVPVICLSGYANDEIKERIKVLKPLFGLLSKPVQAHVLRDTIDGALEKAWD